MDTALAVALVTIFGGAITGGIGKVLWDRYKARDPITRGQAEVALATASLGIVQASRDALSEDVARLTSRVEAQEAHSIKQDAHSREQDTAIARLQARLQRWETWYGDLRARWEEHRQSDQPPPGPKQTD